MSTIDTLTHDLVAYTSGVTKPLTGQRLAVVNYRTDKVTGIKKDSVCVSLPTISAEEITANLNSLLPAITVYLNKVQDDMVRAIAESGSKFVKTNEVDITAIIASLADSDSSGNRLTKESIGNWFDANISETLMVTLADKLGLSDDASDEDLAKVSAITNEYKEKISALAGGKTSYTPKIAESLKKCVALAGSDDLLASKFMVKLDKMISVGSVELFDLL